MGLRTTHDAWLGSYTSFAGWRMGLAGAAGYEVDAQPDPETGRISFTDLCESPYPIADWQMTPQRIIGDWSAEPPPADPLLVLLIHSDCDGHIAPEQAAPLADRLEHLIPKIPEYTNDNEDQMQLQYLTRKFVAGLRQAVRRNQHVIFR